MSAEDDLQITLSQCAQMIEMVMAAGGLHKLQKAVLHNGHRYNFTRRRHVARPEDGLPVAVQLLPRGSQRVFAVIRDLRGERGCGAEVWQKQIRAAVNADPARRLSLRTINRAVKQLCKSGEVHRHDGVGFLLKGQTAALPF